MISSASVMPHCSHDTDQMMPSETQPACVYCVHTNKAVTSFMGLRLSANPSSSFFPYVVHSTLSLLLMSSGMMRWYVDM